MINYFYHIRRGTEMKKIAIILAGILCLTGCAGGNGAASPAEPTPAPDLGPVTDPLTVDEMTATIEMEDGGKIVITLYPSLAPQSVCNFVSLARAGVYDGVIFHRVIEGFMIQGGDPEGTGYGGPGYSIVGEFALNGIENNITHIRGTLSCARQGDPYYDTCGSQFFIVHKDSKFLDGSYAAFGRVTEGMDIVDAIAELDTDGRDRPLEPPMIKTVTIDGPNLPEPDKIMD